MIKPETIAGINRYVEHGVPTGDFLCAVLSNDLMGAMGRADEENRAALFEICGYVYNEIPSVCHGSPEIVEQWLSKFREARAELASATGAER